MKVDEKISTYLQYFGWSLLVVLSAGCGLAAGMHWSCIDVIVLGFKLVEECILLPHWELTEFAWTIPIFPNNPARQ